MALLYIALYCLVLKIREEWYRLLFIARVWSHDFVIGKFV